MSTRTKWGGPFKVLFQMEPLTAVSAELCASKIKGHLIRLEANGASFVEAPCVFALRGYVYLRYAGFWNATYLTAGEGQVYLAWLDAGNVGRHEDALRIDAADVTSWRRCACAPACPQLADGIERWCSLHLREWATMWRPLWALLPEAREEIVAAFDRNEDPHEEWVFTALRCVLEDE